jgi:hypothetical protein
MTWTAKTGAIFHYTSKVKRLPGTSIEKRPYESSRPSASNTDKLRPFCGVESIVSCSLYRFHVECRAMTWAIFPGDRSARAVLELITANLVPSGSERVVAMVGGAMLEEAVDRTLRERLLNISGLVDNLLGVDRPLGNTGPKIDLLRLLDCFDDKTHSAMKGIASVRNFFAHQLDASFDSLDEKFARAMRRLTHHENKSHYPHHLFGPDSNIAIEPVTSKRDQFVVNLKLALIALMRDRVSHHPYANQRLSEEQLLEKFPNRYKADEQPPA